MTALIKKLKDNPLWAFGWSIFTLCLSFEVTHEYAFPDDANYFQHRTLEVNRMADEVERARKAVAIWSDAISSSAETAGNFDRALTAETLVPKRIGATTTNWIQQMTGIRNELSKSLVLLKNMYFEKTAFQELMPKLLQDVALIDRITEKRIQFLNTMLTNFDKAAEIVPSLTSDIEEQRATLEASTRRPMVDHILERGRLEHNDYVRESQSKVRMYKMRSTAAVAAVTYMGAFMGAVIGWTVSQRRLKNRRAKKRKEKDGGAFSKN